MHGTGKKNTPVLCLIALLLALTGCIAPQPQAPQKNVDGLCVLFFNDLHGHLSPFEVREDDGYREVGGIARMAALIRTIREENSQNNVKTLVIVAGDILQGTPMSTVFHGEPDILCLNAMGVDAMTVGNHEFDFGMDNFLRLRQMANFPFLSANIVTQADNTLLCPSHASFSITDTISITVAGVTTRSLLTTTLPANVRSLNVLDSVSAVKAVYEKAEPLGPVLLLSHSRHQTDRDMAEALPDLTAIIGGHDQILLSPYQTVGQVPIFQAFEKGRYLGRIDFRIDHQTQHLTLTGHAYIPVTADMEPDPEVGAIIDTYSRKLDGQFNTVIGQAASFLDGERDRIRYEETGLGNLITDIMRANTGAQIAMLNAGSLRSSIRKGPITIADVFTVMPYENELITLSLTGAEILAVLNRSVRGGREDEDGGFLHVSGVSMDVADHRVTAVRVGEKGKPLKEKDMYTVVITDFLAAGGDGYEHFTGKAARKTGLPLRELIVETIKDRGLIQGSIQGRIRRMD